MQGGQQMKIDQAGLMKAGLIPVIVGAIGGVLWISFGLWAIAGLIGWLAPLFAGVWYVMTKRKAGAMPEQMDALVNGAILGAVVGLVYSILALITAPMGLSSALGGLGGLGGLGFGGFGIGELLTRIIGGAVSGAVAAYVYMLLVKQGTVK